MTIAFTERNRASEPIPACAGIGLKNQHRRRFQASSPDVGWVEVHAENYIDAGRSGLRELVAIRRDYPVSIHGVGLSLGSVDPLNRDLLREYQGLVERVDPFLVSEHLSWSSFDGAFLNDLLPLPYTRESLKVVSKNVAIVQDALKRQILIENPSVYVQPTGNEMDEVNFLKELSRKTGCGILLDVNNVYVTSQNLNLSPDRYIERMLSADVREFHLAGHRARHINGHTILIDDHGGPVAPKVWDLFLKTVQYLGPRPTLIEWDNNVPEMPVLLAEARKADDIFSALYYLEKSRACA